MDDWPREEDGEMTSLSLSMTCLGMQFHLSNLKCHFLFHWNKNVGIVFTSLFLSRGRSGMHIPLQHWKCHLHLKWGWNPWWQWRNLVITLQFKYIYYIKFQVKRKFYNFGKKKLKWCSPGGVYQALVTWWGGRTDQDCLRSKVPGRT